MSRILPILFNTDMVRAILDGRKTVTRRIIKSQQLIGLLPDKCKNGTPEEFLKEKKLMFKPYCDMTDAELIKTTYNPPYQPGDILYVRETWQCWRANRYEATADIRFKAGGDGVSLQFANGSTDSVNRIEYDAFVNKYFRHYGEWKPSLFMPKEAARIFLNVKDVRVEQLQEMNEVDTAKEGIRTEVQTHRLDDPDFIENFGGIELFKDLWNSTIKKSDLDRYGWDANPWVWVIEFERCEKPENE